MFGLFKRTKIEYWETQLLRNVIIKLPHEYRGLLNQIDNGLLKGVLIGISDISGYVAFTFHSDVLKKYDRVNELDFKLSNIKVYDKKLSGFLTFVIYISSGTISGYSLTGAKKHDIDVEKIDVSSFKKEFIGYSDYNRISDILDVHEKQLLNPSDVYSVFLEDKEYFHIKDIGDGDFIGIDLDNNLYKIRHDPFEISILTRSQLTNWVGNA